MKLVNCAVTFRIAAVMLVAAACVAPSEDAESTGSTPAEHTGQVAQSIVGTHKICSAIVPGNYRDSIEVDDGWSWTTCASWAASVNAGAPGATWQLGCLFTNGFAWGAPGNGFPAPNCGW